MGRTCDRLLVSAAILLLVVVAWRADRRAVTPEQPPPTREWRGQYSGESRFRGVAVRDREEWRDLWQKVYGTAARKPPLPHVNFESEMVVGVFLGLTNREGHGVSVTLAPEAGVMNVRYRVEGADGPVVRTISSPFHLVVCPRLSEIRFGEDR